MFVADRQAAFILAEHRVACEHVLVDGKKGEGRGGVGCTRVPIAGRFFRWKSQRVGYIEVIPKPPTASNSGSTDF